MSKGNWTVFEVVAALLGQEHIIVLPKEKVMEFWHSCHPDKKQGDLVLHSNPVGEESVSITQRGATLHLMSMESYQKIVDKASPECDECP